MADAKARVLIVEDEMMISMLLEDLLTDLGYVPAGPATRLDEAMTMAREGAFEAALLDVNLNGKETYGVAEILRQRGIPMIFATGYGASGIPAPYREYPVLTKPFRSADLGRALSQILAAKPR